MIESNFGTNLTQGEQAMMIIAAGLILILMLPTGRTGKTSFLDGLFGN